MSSSRSFRVLFALLALVIAGGVAGGVTIDAGTAPEEKKVGTEVQVTYTFTDLYENYDGWTLRGRTELANATWRVTGYDVTGARVSRTTYPQEGTSGRTFEHAVSASDNLQRIEVRVTGIVPEVESYSFSPPQSLTVATFTRVKGGNTERLGSYSTRPYTTKSREARRTIENAREVVRNSGSADAEQTLQDAIDFYDAERFEKAIQVAERAEQTARNAQQRSQLIQTAIYVVIGLLVLGAIVGGVYWYRSQQRGSRL